MMEQNAKLGEKRRLYWGVPDGHTLTTIIAACRHNSSFGKSHFGQAEKNDVSEQQDAAIVDAQCPDSHAPAHARVFHMCRRWQAHAIVVVGGGGV